MRALLKLAAGTAAVTCGLAACGGGSTASGSPPSGSPTQVVTAAATATQSAGTARADMTFAADFSGLPDQASTKFRITATGAFDVGRKLASLDMDLSSLPGGHHVKIFADGTTVYVNTAGLGLSGAKPWIRLDSTSASSGLTSLASSPFDGGQLLSKLSGVSAVGTETLHGVATTHYRGTLNLGTALSQLGGGTAAGLGQLGQLGPALQNALAATSLPVDAWIDGHDRLRRYSMTMDMAPFMRTLLQQFQTSGSTLPPNLKALISIDFSLFDFGANLDLAPPPANEVGPAPAGFKLPGASL